MKNKIIHPLISFTIIFSLLLTVSTVSASSESAINGNTATVAIGDGLLTIAEKDGFRIVQYVENGRCTQEAITSLETGDIYYKDLNNGKIKATNLNSAKKIDLSEYTYDENYSISDFTTVIENPEIIPAPQTRGTFYYQIDTYGYYDDYNEYWAGYFFAGQGWEKYQSRSWHFPAGTALSVVTSVLGLLITGLTGLVTALVGVVGGFILNILSVNEWEKDYFWRYKIVQSSPEVFTGYTAKYVYQTDTRYDLNNGDTDWETTYYSSYYDSYYQSSTFRDQLIQNIPYHFCF